MKSVSAIYNFWFQWKKKSGPGICYHCASKLSPCEVTSQICALLGFYTSWINRLLLTSWDNLLVPFSWVPCCWTMFQEMKENTMSQSHLQLHHRLHGMSCCHHSVLALCLAISISTEQRRKILLTWGADWKKKKKNFFSIGMKNVVYTRDGCLNSFTHCS